MNTPDRGVSPINRQPGKIADQDEGKIAELKTAHDKSSGRNAILASLWGSLVVIIVIIDFLARRVRWNISQKHASH
jgi:hypothetical protein